MATLLELLRELSFWLVAKTQNIIFIKLGYLLENYSNRNLPMRRKSLRWDNELTMPLIFNILIYNSLLFYSLLVLSVRSTFVNKCEKNLQFNLDLFPPIKRQVDRNEHNPTNQITGNTFALASDWLEKRRRIKLFIIANGWWTDETFLIYSKQYQNQSSLKQ